MCKILHNLDQLFELGVMLWGVALAWGKESDRIGAGGCKVLATWQKVNATTILVLASLAMCMILTGGGEDAEKSTEMTNFKPPPTSGTFSSSGVCVLVYYAAIRAINRAKYAPLSYTLPIHFHHPSTRNV